MASKNQGGYPMAKGRREMEDGLIRNLLAKQAKEDNEKFQVALKWPSNEDKKSICNAVAIDQDYVFLSNPSRFGTISLTETPERMFYIINDDKNPDMVFIKPASGFAPCGWFDINRLRAELEQAKQ